MGMVPLVDEAIARALGRDGAEGGSVSLRHALIHRSPGLWGDHPRRPRSVVLVREGDGPEGWHAFGLGEAEPAVGWLSGRGGRRLSLLAPTTWEGAIRRRGAAVARGIVETWVRSGGGPGEIRRGPSPIARRLGLDDGPAFERSSVAFVGAPRLGVVRGPDRRRGGVRGAGPIRPSRRGRLGLRGRRRARRPGRRHRPALSAARARPRGGLGAGGACRIGPAEGGDLDRRRREPAVEGPRPLARVLAEGAGGRALLGAVSAECGVQNA